MDSPGVLFQAPTGHKFSPGKTLQHILSSAPWPWEMHGNAAFMSEHVNLQVKFMNEKLEFLVGFTSENGDECGKNWDLST